MNRNIDYYQVLGVSRSATNQELKIAYRSLALRYHPDQNPGSKEAEEKFKELAEAYSVLSDPEQRIRYDGAGLTLGNLANSFDSTLEAVKKFFEGVFGQFGDWGKSEGKKGKDLHHTIRITLEESFAGVTKSFSIQSRVLCTSCEGSGADQGRAGWRLCLACEGTGEVKAKNSRSAKLRSCAACQGTGRVILIPCSSCQGQGFLEKKKEVSVHLPQGVEQGSTQKLEQQGEPSQNGGPPGDLLVLVDILPHPLFQREGSLLFCEVPIRYTQAILGGLVEVPTLEGKTVSLKIPKALVSGVTFRLKGKGFPIKPNATERGDAHYHILVEPPQDLSLTQIQLLQAFDQALEPQNQPLIAKFREKVQKI